MKYSLVRQFSNNTIDNFFKFFYKIADFARIWVEVFWAFFEIWEALFLIFFNIFMYIYYLILFVIDKSTESQSTVYFWRRLPKRVPFTPSRVYVRDSPNPVPGLYGSQAADMISKAGSAIASTAARTVSSSAERLQRSASGARGSIIKKTLEFFGNMISSIAGPFTGLRKSVGDTIARKMKPVPEEPAQRGGSLIDQYMKEYEKKKKA